MPILFGLIIEGKYLPPYKRTRKETKKNSLIENEIENGDNKESELKFL